MPSLTAKNVGNYLLNINLIKLLWHYSQIIPVIIHSVFTECLYTVQKTGTPERKCTNIGPVSTQARQRGRLAPVSGAQPEVLAQNSLEPGMQFLNHGQEGSNRQYKGS